MHWLLSARAGLPLLGTGVLYLYGVSPGPEINGVSVLQTHYLAVNPWTGDVWDAMGCEMITSSALQKEQNFIWKRSGLPADAKLPLHDKSPASCSLIDGKKK